MERANGKSADGLLGMLMAWLLHRPLGHEDPTVDLPHGDQYRLHIQHRGLGLTDEERQLARLYLELSPGSKDLFELGRS